MNLKMKTSKGILLLTTFVAGLLGLFVSINAQDKTDENDSNAQILNQYIKSKGSNLILFDASNIKQFWTDKSVVSLNGLISITPSIPNKTLFDSPAYKTQLANVLETQDCKVEIISENPDVAFSILDSSSKKVSSSVMEEDFIHYHVFSSTFHLEDIDNFQFALQFSSKTADPISIKKIILTFVPNEKSAFLGSPGFDILLKEFEEKGITVQDKDVQYIISKKYNKIFFKVLNQYAAQDYTFFCHSWPVDEKDLLPNRVQYGSNNNHFTTRRKTVAIPKPYSCQSEYAIVQIPLPSYKCSKIEYGEFSEGNGKRVWALSLDGID